MLYIKTVSWGLFLLIFTLALSTMSAVFRAVSPVSGPARQALVDGLASVWRADSLGDKAEQTVPTGHGALDAVLPGGGWPRGVMTELLQPAVGALFWPLVLPALASALRDASGPVVLIGAPHMPFAPALAACGVPGERVLWVRGGTPASNAWACEQALRCGEVAAVLAWLPQARLDALRRLHLAAYAHQSLLWVLRPVQQGMQQAHSATPARLRLQVEPGPVAGDMAVTVLKRRGPPLARPLVLPAWPAPVAAVLAARGARRRVVTLPSVVLRPPEVVPHALDRIAVAA